ncbi:3-deoxy-D-manno-octulosonic acid kinase [Marinospirillum perlucidum]|uniref:3-deoxy-D-manno-octulosonic acid kinase n=1 Tax=Marinospirillum perlucidum TaxID=1982602 RepID=UPI000DF46661|nr:3-deoxy-D-manno-octulosonic acid kinase [Marinospirillum perlucidum]
MVSFRQIEDQGQFILYDPEYISQIHSGWFTADFWKQQQALLGGAPGRGTSAFIKTPAGEAVWRHYHRGGLPGRFIQDYYLWTGLDNTRPWQEMQLTQELYQRGLPVPKPLAARVHKHGLFYQADLITLRIPSARPLAEFLLEQTVKEQQAALLATGKALVPFHQAGLNHTDLNPRNLLIQPQTGKIWVIDLDRCELLDQPGQVPENNLARLYRGLVKLDAAAAPQWQEWLLAGYTSASK